jgi:hypothetical protein
MHKRLVNHCTIDLSIIPSGAIVIYDLDPERGRKIHFTNFSLPI